MTTADQSRIAQDRQKPRISELWWALRPLTSVVRFMQTGAHPDDEISGMLAALALRDGVNISYACSTRGEGGQNDIGTEAGIDLGALRTKEMEAACDVLGMRMYWHSTSADDTITDFGFSKSGDETLARWGRDRTILRFAEIVRTERPDIICPTFLDVPGQHGHHRAMTEAAHAVMSAAADSNLPSNLPPWQIKKLYLPAWSGAGQSYDDDLPPPDATLTIPGRDREPMSGWTWERIGQQSRAFHRTQGMGRWTPPDTYRDWPLHLAESHVLGPDVDVFSGLPRRVQDLVDLPGAEAIASELKEAGQAIDAAVAAFPDFERVGAAALSATEHLRAALNACPPALLLEIEHRLTDKICQLGHVVRLALSVEARAYTTDRFLAAGMSTKVTTEVAAGAADSAELSLDLPTGWSISNGSIVLDASALSHDPYRAAYDPRVPTLPRLNVAIHASGTIVETHVPFDDELVILPGRRASISPQAAVLNTAKEVGDLTFDVTDISPSDASLALNAPTGWHVQKDGSSFRVTAPSAASPGDYQLDLSVDGASATTVRQIAYDHISATAQFRPAVARVAVLNVAVPKARVAYIGGGNDRVCHWLTAIGIDVTDLSDSDLSQDGLLYGFDSLVIGIFAMRFRPGLTDALPTIHRLVEAGGTLLTLYHRPWDNWDPETVPPRRLEIGQPSLRWRVTDETAVVTHIAEHPILQGPNVIGPEDWDGWVKERGLYFAKSWDDAYTPLIELSDPGEAPHRGALLVADVGAGRHIHTSLILHHQMENLVPGAFKLMANFVARRE